MKNNKNNFWVYLFGIIISFIAVLWFAFVIVIASDM